MDKINTVSSQAVLEVSFSVDTRSMSSSLLVNSLAKNRLFYPMLKFSPSAAERHSGSFLEAGAAIRNF